jgi:hypothetical protein
MRKIIFLILYLCFIYDTKAQLYGNEWINYSQDYYKIKIGKEGIYKINYNTLQSVGFPVTTINPKNIQLWINGKEQPINVVGQSDNTFDNTDYIEFYGTYNDGKLDMPLYPNPSEQPHPYMSLYSDTAIYFLTVSATNVGKRVEINNDKNFTGKTGEPYFFYEQALWYAKNGTALDGLGYSTAGFHTEYTEGEGWAAQFTGGGTKANFLTPQINLTGPKSYIEVLAHSRGDNTSSYDVDGYNNGLNLTFDASATLIESKRVVGLKRYFFQDSLDNSLMGSQNTIFKLTSFLLAKSQHSVAYFKLVYPRLFHLNDSSNFKFNYLSSNNFIKFNRYASSKSKPIIYDITNHKLSLGEIIGSDLYCNLSNINGAKTLLLLDETSILSINTNNLKPYKFNELKFSSSHNYLVISNPTLDSGARAYSDFLNSSIGGSFNTYLAFTNDIYDQFYYGLKHPMAIKNFCRFGINTSGNLKYLLLLGKGHVYTSTKYNQAFDLTYNLVPSYGTPPSDYFYTSGFNGSQLEPLLSTGRIPAKSNREISNYLTKISAFKQLGYEDWKKRILQLGGGSNPTEISSFSAILENYYTIVKQPYWGASHLKITKNDPAAIDTSLTDKIQNAINEGYAMISYFGHGAAEATDVSLGNPKKLKNINKYPIFYLNGCVLGNIFNGNSLAEEYLFGENKGAIGWLAGTAFGDVTTLDEYAKILHSNLTLFPEKSITENVSKTIKTFQSPSYAPNKAQCRQMIFLGDPSLQLFNAEKPDYTVNKNSFEILPKNVTADADSFGISFTIDNLALATKDSFKINIYQKYPSGVEKLVASKKLPYIPNNNTVVFWVKTNKQLNIAGLNYFTIHIDSGNFINEQFPNGEINNEFKSDYYFPSNRAIALLPEPNSIVNSNKVTLMAQLLSNSNAQKVIFELDTTLFFDSPKKQSLIINNSEVLKKADFVLMPYDSIDYFWRVKVDDGTINNTWSISTFSFIYGSSLGWSQGYWQKFVESKQDNLKLSIDKHADFLTYQSNKYDLYSGKTNPNAGPSIWQSFHPLFFGYVTTGITVTAINPKNEDRLIKLSKYNVNASSSPWWGVNPTKFFAKYYLPSGSAKSCAYGFNTTIKENRDSLITFLNTIPSDYYILITAGNTTGVKQWEDTLYKTFEELGGFSIRTVGENEPYTLVTKRNAPISSIFEKTADYSSAIPPIQQSISFTTYFDILSSRGSLTSNPIGPSSKWSSMYSTLLKSDSDSDKVSYEVYGITKAGTDTLLISNIRTTSQDLTAIDAKVFPFIKLKTLLRDSLNKTPLLLKRWTVLYDGIPEGMVNTDLANYLNKDTLDEGDSIEFKIAYQNISDLSMDSILVTVNEIDEKNKVSVYYTKKFKALLKNDFLIIHEKLATKGKTKNNTIQIIFNPNNNQPELYAFNNVYRFNYFINNDNKNPYLDVVFDGRHITNQEIISPNPSITITAVDENKYFYLDNASYFTVKLKEPGKSSFRELNLLTDTFEFIAAKGPNSKCKLIYNPLNLKDGIYELSVSVKDASGNLASEEDYKISFKVVTKSSITNVYPYPNPFTTKTRFVFTLTGDKTPDYFKISVISISGTVVKEITLDEFGPINIGNNISKYEWDGTDTYGDKLGNGVYLYKVTAKLNGKDIDLSETAGDTYFKKEMGKLYIMR